MHGQQDKSFFEYGVNGERVEKRTGSGTIVRYFGPEFERAYEKGLWHDELYVTVGGERLAYVSTAVAVQGKVFCLHPDVQGTIGVVTDEGGEVAKYTLYAPFGKTVRIRDDAAGDYYGEGDPQNRGPHFNDEQGGHYDY